MRRSRPPPANNGAWFTPPANPPTIKEQKWKKVLLKANVAAAGDSGAIDIFTPIRLRELVQNQFRVPAPSANEVMLVRVHSVMSYSLPGVADSGAQTYPSTKLYIYDLNNPQAASTSWSMETSESSGTLDTPARIGYTYPGWMQTIPILATDDATSELFKCENYHSARGYIFAWVSYCFTDE